MEKELEALKKLAQMDGYQIINDTIARLKKIGLDDKIIDSMLVYVYQKASNKELDYLKFEKMLNTLPMIDADEMSESDKPKSVVLSMEEANFLIDLLQNPSKLLSKDINFVYVYATLEYDDLPMEHIRFMNNISILHLISLIVKHEYDDVNLNNCRVRYFSDNSNEDVWLSKTHLKTLVSEWLVEKNDGLDIYFGNDELTIKLLVNYTQNVQYGMLEYLKKELN